MKKIGILGSTGSIGTQALSVIEASPDRYSVEALSCGRNIGLLMEQIDRFSPALAVVESNEDASIVKAHCRGTKTQVLSGMAGLQAIASSDADIILTSLVGSVGLLPTLTAIDAGKTIALANKETLVTAGKLVMGRAKERQVAILPVDSEHSAIFQCLQGNTADSVSKIVLTASGGPFRDLPEDVIRSKLAVDALKHPNWAMGAKITIDSATMMNKGLEVIEARWLFDIPLERIDVVVHPQSIIHSMVAYKDTSVIAQMGLPDMRLPIHYALNYPDRTAIDLPELDLSEIATLTFSKPDTKRFPCLNLAFEALRIGGTMPCVLNAANEVLVEQFLKGSIGFYDISDRIEKIMGCHRAVEDYTLEDLIHIDNETRKRTSVMEGGYF